MKQLLILLGFLSMVACQSSTPDQALQEAADLHNKAIQVEKKVKPQMDQLSQLKNALAVQQRTLTESEQSFVDYVTQIETLYRYWEENHVEVPGYGHEGHDHHDHAHDHDHDHGPALELSSEDMLIVQREFRDSILQIEKYTQTALGMFENIAQ